MNLTELLDLNESGTIIREKAVGILQLPDEYLDMLVEAAFRLRTKYKGNRVSVQLLTNVRSGNCSQDCAYCAQSCRSTADIGRYRSIPDEKLYSDNTLVNEKHLARHCIGLSGISFTDDEISELAGKIKKMKESSTHICCSIGFLTEKQAKMLKDAGLDRINHNLNSSRRFYPNICTTHIYDRRLENLRMLKRLGFEICCGGIVGMGESAEDIADMLLDIKEISPESVPINFLLPIKGTRLAESSIPALSYEYCTKVLCLARLMMPGADIRCAAGREVYFEGHERTLFMIADSIFAAGYLTADGQSIDETFRVIREAGFSPFADR